MPRKLFCEYNKVFYRISLQKEYLKRDIYDAFSSDIFANTSSTTPLPVIVKGARSKLLKKLDGVDMSAQEHKVTNLKIALKNINGLVIYPNETFSFWHSIGKPTVKKGYLSGLTLTNGAIGYSIGGGLCQLSNITQWLILHSPLQVTELHHHSDAIFPDTERRVPFGTGTSVFYKNVDYRFKNETDQPVQLQLWCDETDLCGELRTTKDFPYKYRLVEENHYFAKENGRYYRNSSIYRIIKDRQNSVILEKELILQNHSAVLYDSSKIPTELIKETT